MKDKSKIKKIKKFDKWMLKIKNIYYHDHLRMVNAYERIK